MKEFANCVFIARLQPPHRAHINVIDRALDKADDVIIVLGSDRSAPTVRNPWTTKEREEMVLRCFSYEKKKRIKFVSVRDQPYNNTNWIASVHQKVTEIANGGRTALIGHHKDHTSFYLDLFPQWEFIEMDLMAQGLSATEVREQYFAPLAEQNHWKDLHWHNSVHEGVKDFMTEFMKTERYTNLAETHAHLKEYKASWDSAPFPPVFVTTDSVVVKLGHILLIKRGANPGKGLTALPGGFLQEGYTLVESNLNELKEETKIKVDRSVLRSHIKDKAVFDSVNRSGRGRTVSHAFYIKLPDEGYLPEVAKGKSDDADGSFWCPIGDLRNMEKEFFEDHLDIIEHFTMSA